MNEQQYTQVVADRDISGEPIPLDDSRFAAMPSPDPMLAGFISVTSLGSGVTKEVLTEADFRLKYSPINETPAPTPAPAAPVVQSPNGTHWAISVSDDGTVIANPVTPTDTTEVAS